MYDAIGYFTYSVVRAMKGHRHALIFLRLERPWMAVKKLVADIHIYMNW